MDDHNCLPSSSRLDRQVTENKVVDVMANRWTDKKHSLYLDSMEASFVNQLYNRGNHSNYLVGWLSRTRTCTNKYVSDPEKQTFGPFKVPRRDCCDKVKSERLDSDDDIGNRRHRLPKNLWIQHFRPRSTSSKPHLSSANEMEDNELVCQSIQESVGCMTEASDQNFVDVEVERGEEPRSRSKKRARRAISPSKDQVVPSAGQTSEEEKGCSSRKKLEIMREVSEVEPESS